MEVLFSTHYVYIFLIRIKIYNTVGEASFPVSHRYKRDAAYVSATGCLEVSGSRLGDEW